jgi:hypothetical protein
MGGWPKLVWLLEYNGFRWNGSGTPRGRCAQKSMGERIGDCMCRRACKFRLSQGQNQFSRWREPSYRLHDYIHVFCGTSVKPSDMHSPIQTALLMARFEKSNQILGEEKK